MLKMNIVDQNNTNHQLNDTLTEIGGIAYLLKFSDEVIPYTLLNIFGTVFGCTGNLLIIGSIILSKELHTETNMLIFNLSLADLTISGFVNSFTFVGILIGKSFFDRLPWLCDMIGAVCLIACGTSLMNILFLAINRYINICHHKIYNKIFTIKKTLIYCILNWVAGFFVDLPNLVGWGGHYYDSKTLSCIWNRLKSHSYSVFFPSTAIIIPCICIFICYMKIFTFARNSKNKVLNTNGKKNWNQDLQQSVKLAKGLFGSFMLFTLCWLPYGLIVMIDFQDRFPRPAHMFPIAIAHFNSTLNPIFYALSNPKFKRGYKRLFRFFLYKAGLMKKFSSAEFSKSVNHSVHTVNTNQNSSLHQ